MLRVYPLIGDGASVVRKLNCYFVARFVAPVCRSGKAAALVTKDGKVYIGRSTGAGGGPLDPIVENAWKEFDGTRSPFHGKCAEPRAIAAAIKDGADLKVAVIKTVGIGKHQGLVKAPCSSCEWIIKYFLKYLK